MRLVGVLGWSFPKSMGGPRRESEVSLLVKVPRGTKAPWSMGWVQGKGSAKAPSMVSMKSSPWNGLGFGGRNARQVDGCRESEVSRECLTGDTVYWL